MIFFQRTSDDFSYTREISWGYHIMHDDNGVEDIICEMAVISYLETIDLIATEWVQDGMTTIHIHIFAKGHILS